MNFKVFAPSFICLALFTVGLPFWGYTQNQINSNQQESMVLRRPPGREAFPGDVFYQRLPLYNKDEGSINSSERIRDGVDFYNVAPVHLEQTNN